MTVEDNEFCELDRLLKTASMCAVPLRSSISISDKLLRLINLRGGANCLVHPMRTPDAIAAGVIAARIAKQLAPLRKFLPLMLPAGLARVQIYRHTANWVLGRHSIGRNNCMAVMMAVIVLVHGLTLTSMCR